MRKIYIASLLIFFPLIFSVKAFGTGENIPEETLIEFLETEVPEIKKIGAKINKKSKGKSYITVFLDGSPDNNSKNKYEKEYYRIYVGEQQGSDTVNICWFLIHKDTKEILFWDSYDDKYSTLDEWRSEMKK